MVLLTMTTAIVAAVERYNEVSSTIRSSPETEPSLEAPEIGNPISHGQLIDIYKALKSHQQHDQETTVWHFDHLLKGAKVYVPPPIPRREQTPEYQTLMAQLRHQEEERIYHGMINSSTVAPFGKQHSEPLREKFADEEDEVTFSEIKRQVTLIINVLVTIVACSIAIWIIARHWPAPARLALSMCGSGVVGVAEVVIYSSYLRKVKDAKIKERSKKEQKSVINTWIIDPKAKEDPVRIQEPQSSSNSSGDLRLRKVKKG